MQAAHLLTNPAQPRLHSPGIVDIDVGRIVWSGPAEKAPAVSGEIQKLDGLLMPGLVNTHAHTPMVLLRGAGEGLPVSTWLTEVMWPREGELGLRAVVTPPVLVADDLALFGGWEEQLDAMVEQAERWRDHELISIGFGPHSAYALPEEPLVRVVELARKSEMHIQIHVAEGRQEGDAVRERTGLSVPAYLDRLGMLDGHVVAAHCVWLTPQDIELFSDRRTAVAHCPCSNSKHASGFAPVRALRSAGVAVGLGTDGPASHDRLDLFEEMRMALRLARLAADDAGAMGPPEVLAMATVEGARALGRPDLGRIEAGCRADLIHLDVSSLYPVVEENDLLTHLVYLGNPSLVRDVWVEGRRVVEDSEVTTIDVARVRAEMIARAKELAR
ncbi:MAG: amidohydrolase family protein [Actinobacteria bacterium]|nr:amidohydrolase family protein [Actinomycetota bacterium]